MDKRLRMIFVRDADGFCHAQIEIPVEGAIIHNTYFGANLKEAWSRFVKDVEGAFKHELKEG